MSSPRPTQPAQPTAGILPCCTRERCCKCGQKSWAIYWMLNHYLCGQCRGRKP